MDRSPRNTEPVDIHGDVAQQASPRRGRVAKSIALMGWCMGAVLVTIGAYLLYLIPTTPTVEALRKAHVAQPTVLLANDGERLAVLRRTHQERVPLQKISPHLVDALLATEDHRFYRHAGVDLRRTTSAVVHTLMGDAQGGSTITQQLARNLFPEEVGRARTVHRKLKELVVAFKIEQAYEKDQILETYLNTVPFLYNVFGVEMAARTYFDKNADELDVLESATLIGMLKGTSYYNPVLNPERAHERRNVVLRQMVKRGKLTEQAYQQLHGQELKVALHRQPDPFGAAPHFVTHVRKWLIEWADKNDYDIYADGLTVETTIDPVLQAAAVDAVKRQTALLQSIADVEWSRPQVRVVSHSPNAYVAISKQVEPFAHMWRTRNDLVDAFVRETPQYRKAIEFGATPQVALAQLRANRGFMERLRDSKTRLEAGFVAMDPVTGEVKAWVGSREFDVDQYDHVVQAARQPGSTFKPFVYGAALERGMAPSRTYYDFPVEMRLTDGTVWRPSDMSGASGRAMSLKDGLVYSKNSITAQVMQEVGLPSIMNLARSLGVRKSKLDPVPSLALGTSPVTLLEMTSAYASIANLGEYREPVYIKRVRDRFGNVLVDFTSSRHRAMSQDSAIELLDMMRGVVSRGTGASVKARFALSADLAGKTGTTQNNTDAWFILMHPDLVTGSWVGFNDTRVALRSNYWGQGGHSAALLVGDFFKEAVKARKVNSEALFPRPVRRYDYYYSVPQAEPPVYGNEYDVTEEEDDGFGAYEMEPPQPAPRIEIIQVDSRSSGVQLRTAGIRSTSEKRESLKTPEELQSIIDNINRNIKTSSAASRATLSAGATATRDARFIGAQ